MPYVSSCVPRSPRSQSFTCVHPAVQARRTSAAEKFLVNFLKFGIRRFAEDVLCTCGHPFILNCLFLRDSDAKMRPGKLIRIHQFYDTVVCLYALLHNCETYAVARDVPPLFLLALKERVENARSFVIRNTRSGIRKFEFAASWLANRTDGNAPPPGGELDGI